jgi:WD40 repeat protein
MLTGLAISPDGTRAASSSMDGTLTFLDGTRFESARVLRAHLLGTHSVTFSPRGQRVVSTSARNEAAKLWDVHSQQEVATLGSSSEIVSQATFSPDGRALVAVDLRGQLSVWKAPTFEEIQAVEQTGARSISIFPDSAP